MNKKFKFSFKQDEKDDQYRKIIFHNPDRGVMHTNRLSQKLKETYSFSKSALSSSMSSLINQNTSNLKLGEINSEKTLKRTQENFEISDNNQEHLNSTIYLDKKNNRKSKPIFLITEVDKNQENEQTKINKKNFKNGFSNTIKVKEETKKKKKIVQKYTLKHRETVRRNLEKFSHYKYDQNPQKQNSLAISLEDEIFNVVPELQLISNQNGNHRENKEDLYIFFKKLRKPKKRRNIFDAIYKIDEEFLNKVDIAKKNKDNFNLLEYQNQLMLLLSYRVCRENLLKLSENLKDIREKAEEVDKTPEIKWDQVKEDIEGCRVILNKNQYGEYEDLISLNTRRSPNKHSENKTLKINNEKDDLVLPKIDVLQKKIQSSNKSKLLRKRDSFLPSYLVDKLNSVLRIKL